MNVIVHPADGVHLQPEVAADPGQVAPELRSYASNPTHPVLGAEHHVDADMVGLMHVPSLRDSDCNGAPVSRHSRGGLKPMPSLCDSQTAPAIQSVPALQPCPAGISRAATPPV